MEKFEENKEYFGVYVLQSNSGLSAEEVFVTYKKDGVLKRSISTLRTSEDLTTLCFRIITKNKGSLSSC